MTEDGNREYATVADPASGWREDLPELVGGLISEALRINASDIHVDAVAHHAYRICCRVDGVIHPLREVAGEQGRQLVNQIKVAAQFTPDHTFTRLENRIALDNGTPQREIRVTIVPTSRGDAVHLRFLSPPEEVLRPADLGMSQDALARIRRTLLRPEGLILISGPTGAGKTMTLYSLAEFLNLSSMIAVSVEDPVEYDLPYVRQIQADAEHGLSMQEALKTVLRMDPDIIMIGEIRDAASAIAAVRAAASGRFVLATLHATDAALAVETCHYFAVPRHLLGSSLRMTISQVLIRKICPACAGRRDPSDGERNSFREVGLEPPDVLPVAEGCQKCHGFGYHGRIAVFEVHEFDRSMADAVSRARGSQELRDILEKRATPSLRQEALRKVAAGITTMEEINDLHYPGSPES